MDIKGWNESIQRVKRALEYGIHCNDLSHHELEEEICFAFDHIAHENGLPDIDWEYHEEEDDPATEGP